MADINQIVQEQSYRGDPGLAGYNTPILIDVKPLDDLARYTMIYNKSMYDDNEKKAQQQAKDLADLATYDLTAIPEESKQLQGEYDKLYNFVRANPNVLDYKNNPTGYTDYIKMKNDLNQKVRTAKARNVVYEKWQSDISNATDPKMKALLKKELTENIKSTNIDTPLPAQQKFDITPVEVKPADPKTFDVTDIGGNQNVKRKITTYDPNALESQANALALGLKKLYISPEELASKTKEEQDAYAAQIASGKLEPVETAKTLAETIAALPKDANGNPDFTNAPDMVKGYLTQVQQYNKRINQDKNELANPNLVDNFGKPLFGNQRGLLPENYKEINPANPTPEALIKMRILAATPVTAYDTITTPTDNTIQKTIAAETRRHNIAEEGLKGKELNQLNEKFKASQKGGETVINGALVKADRIYNELAALADKNGVITPDKIRQMTVEQRKYMGIEQPSQVDQNGVVVDKGGYKPIDLEGQVAIQLDNGRINVFKPAQNEKTIRFTDDGRAIGNYDNTRSTTKYNMATNIINEELKNAGSKELSTYFPSDVAGTSLSPQSPISTNTTGGSVAGSGSASSTVRVQGANGKVYIVPQSDVDGVLKANKGAKIIQ